ncbi:Protein unc-80 like [Melia azedarach]|uniref:Protein unc-80 like n=1 Tax=Melia azedarach TaxID=155640 RepID=A0ACC1YS16_MELAZ|nr:Protein unc-80 like [Melia azedarach]
MASSCMSTCINDARVPVRATYANLYKWPESDAEFVRAVSSDGRRGGLQHSRVVDSISCRQIYLRSYTFSRKKETVHEKITSKCFGRAKERGSRRNRRSNKTVVTKRKCLVLRRVKEVSCSALLYMFRKLLSCTAKVDVADHDHGEIYRY